MRNIVLGCAAAVLAAQSAYAATVSVSAFKGTVYGPGEATLAFTGVDAAQEVWVAWDEADKGADFACRNAKTYIIQRLNTRKGFTDVAHFKKHLFIHCNCLPSFQKPGANPRPLITLCFTKLSRKETKD